MVLFSAGAYADDVVPTATEVSASPRCPIGVVKCAKHVDDWSLCKKNALLDFFVPGLPTTGDRSTAFTDAEAARVESGDKSHYVLEGNARIQQLDQLLRADKIVYDNDTTNYSASGNVKYQDRGEILSADRVEGRTDPQETRLDNVRYQLL